MRYLVLLFFSGALQAGGFLWLPIPQNIFFICLAPLVLGLLVTRFQAPQTGMGRIYGYYLMLVPFLGPFATFGASISILILSRHQQKQLDHYHDQLSGAIHVTEMDKVRFQLTENLWTEDNEQQAEPFLDIMKGSDRVLKQRAIDKVIQHPSQLSVRVLREGLSDNDSDVRYYAASGLIQLNDLFQKRLQLLKEKVGHTSNDADFWYQLGSAYDQYCFWELPASDDMEYFLKETEGCYQTCLALQPDHEKVRYALGRLLVRRRQIDRAIEVLREGLEYHPESIPILGWYAEALYKGKRFVELEKFTRKCSFSMELPDNLAEPFNYWAFGSEVFQYQEAQLNAGQK
ncbi:MAG: hypothetical protein HQM14_04315 [SAR324 cluster bacterium]|nr:hypothetical protein [SAR324 cluster bacterium]